MISEVVNALLVTYLASEYWLKTNHHHHHNKNDDDDDDLYYHKGNYSTRRGCCCCVVDGGSCCCWSDSSQPPPEYQWWQWFWQRRSQKKGKHRRRRRRIHVWTILRMICVLVVNSLDHHPVVHDIVARWSLTTVLSFWRSHPIVSSSSTTPSTTTTTTSHGFVIIIAAAWQWFVTKLLHVPRILFAAITYMIGLYYDCHSMIQKYTTTNTTATSQRNTTHGMTTATTTVTNNQPSTKQVSMNQYQYHSNNLSSSSSTTTATTSLSSSFALTGAYFGRQVMIAFCQVLPLYPFLAVVISFGFLFVISLFEFLRLPLEWLNWPIYYGTLYGPFSLVYWKVKRTILEDVISSSSLLPI